MMNYAVVEDIIESGRSLSAEEMNIAKRKITEASAMIRARARQLGKDFDTMIAQNVDLLTIANSVVCSTVIRYLNDSKTNLQ